MSVSKDIRTNLITNGILHVISNLEVEFPLLVDGIPPREKIEDYVRAVFSEEELLRQGVLIAPQVYVKKEISINEPEGVFVGYAVLLQVEGVGINPEAAVLSSRFITDDQRVATLDEMFQEMFADEISLMADSSYERRPDRERGIFFKLGVDGEFIGHDSWVNIPIEDLRRDADGTAQFLSSLATVEETELEADLARRVQYFDQIINENNNSLLVAGVLEQVAAAEQAHMRARQKLMEAQREFRRAERYGKMAAAAQWAGFGLEIAGVLRADVLRERASQKLDDALSDIKDKSDKLDAAAKQFNEATRSLNSALSGTLQGMTTMDDLSEAFFQSSLREAFFMFGIGFTDEVGNDYFFYRDTEFSKP